MAECKFCGAEVKIGSKCEYCGRFAETWYYHNEKQIGKTVKKLYINFISKNKRIHTVVCGESLFSIAKKYYGDGSYYSIIAKANKLKNHDYISKGDILIIPNVNEIRRTDYEDIC